LAAELVLLRPDVILAIGGDVAEFAKKATQTVPLVFISSADPEQLGLVASLGRPGGNATGVTLLQDELASKRLELLKEATPRVSSMPNRSNSRVWSRPFGACSRPTNRCPDRAGQDGAPPGRRTVNTDPLSACHGHVVHARERARDVKGRPGFGCQAGDGK
jgi:ABC transporter substrate binding protein